LLKLKRFLDDEAEVIGFEEKMSNHNVKEVDERGYSKRSSKKAGLVTAGTLGSLIVRWKGVIFNIGSGFTDKQRQEIWDNKEKYLGKWFTFQYQELTSYGIPRFPTGRGFRSDLDMGVANE
jgi:DNA ligase-1